jgi:hypothetical protein
MLNLHWCIETNLMAIEAIAAGAGVELGEVEEPAPAVSAYGPAYRHLEGSLAGLPADDPVSRYELRKSVRLARHVERIGEIGDQVVAADLADIAKLTGWRADSWAGGEADLERLRWRPGQPAISFRSALSAVRSKPAGLRPLASMKSSLITANDSSA